MLQVVIPEDQDWEKEWDEWHDQLWSQWKKITPPELYRQKYSTESFTGNDDEEEWAAGPRVTEADHKNDTKSLERKLDRRLFLLLKREGDSHLAFVLMQACSAFCKIFRVNCKFCCST